MKCYQHRENEAVGVCLTCGKGVCQNCVIEVDSALYCSNGCVPEDRMLYILKGRFMGQLITLFFAITLLIWALIDYPTISNFTLAFAGIMFFAIGKSMIGK